jgi:hypothetical protein
MIPGLLLGIGIGAGLMFMLDPVKGRRRQALVRDKLIRVGHALGDLPVVAGNAGEQVWDRTRGIALETRARLEKESVPDEILTERVRAAIGRVASHPRALMVNANGGVVTLSGPILVDEVDQLLGTVEGVRGVVGVENRLEIRETPEGIPSLQGQPREPKRALQ